MITKISFGLKMLWRLSNWFKIPHTGDKESLDQCGPIPKNPPSKAKFSVKLFFLRGDFTPFMNKSFQIWDHFFPLLLTNDSKNLKSLDIGLWKVGAQRRLNRVNKCKKSVKKKLFLPRRFYTIFEQKCSTWRPLLSITFPQGFQISSNFGHWTSGSGGKKTNCLKTRWNRPHW